MKPGSLGQFLLRIAPRVAKLPQPEAESRPPILGGDGPLNSVSRFLSVILGRERQSMCVTRSTEIGCAYLYARACLGRTELDFNGSYFYS